MRFDPTEQRLRNCFQAVFPFLGEEEIESATPESVEQWDSIATVRLAAAVEEEFSVALELESSLSFREILSFLRQRLALA
jgi:acyl carrier protein